MGRYRGIDSHWPRRLNLSNQPSGLHRADTPKKLELAQPYYFGMVGYRIRTGVHLLEKHDNKQPKQPIRCLTCCKVCNTMGPLLTIYEKYSQKVVFVWFVVIAATGCGTYSNILYTNIRAQI